jgi:hypothetical protein
MVNSVGGYTVPASHVRFSTVDNAVESPFHGIERLIHR